MFELKEGENFAVIRAEAEVVIDDWLANITKITDMVTSGKLDTF